MNRSTWLCVLVLLVCSTPDMLSQSRASDDKPDALASFVDDYFAAYFACHPAEGTGAGFHQYDAMLDDRSAKSYADRIAAVKGFQHRLEKIRTAKLNLQESIDAEILDGRIRSELLDLEILATWRKNPMSYVSAPSESVDGLMKRNFAPARQRLVSIVARLKKAPLVLAAMKANLDNPPQEFTELGIRIAEGSISFFQDNLRDWAKQAAEKDEKLLGEFTAANDAVIKALTEAVAWMKSDLLPRSKGSYAIGAKNFADKLLYDDLVDIPIPKLLEIAKANLKKDQDAFAAIASTVDKSKSPAEMMKWVSDDHATENDLIPAARRTIEQARKFLIDKEIITIPSEIRPIVTETPVFSRYGSGASMDTAGPFETVAKEAFYYVTPVEPNWDAKHKDEHLRAFNNPVMQIVTIHEAFPGHFIQFLYAKDYPSKTRKLTYCNTNVEGWAHYTEQMIVEQGYGNGDPKIRLAQLSEALLRDCRFLVAINLHTQGMTVDQGKKFFEEGGYLEPAMAFEEASRGAYDPTYLVYTLGKLQIYKLREDYKKRKGNAFNLKTFHNEFILQGGIPIKLMRRILLPNDTSPVL